MKKIRKRYITLLEIMVVIFLIGVIGGIIGINVKNSMNKAKKTQTKIAAEKIKDALMYAIADGANPNAVEKAPEDFLKDSPLIRGTTDNEIKKLMTDGKGERFGIKINKKTSEVIVKSKYLDEISDKE